MEKRIMEKIRVAWEEVKARLPVLGIVAFSVCSVNALYNLLASNAENPIEAFWAAALLVELVTAWLVGQTVETARQLTRSKLSKQDKKFYTILLVAFVVGTVPSLALSVKANTVEFGGTLWLGLVFPGMSVACAVGAALPGVAIKHEQRKDRERTERAKAKAEKNREKTKRQQAQDKEASERQQMLIREEQRASDEHQRETERQQMLDSLSTNARQILISLASDAQQTQSSMAQALGVRPQTVGHHIKSLAKKGLISRNGQGIKVLVEVNNGVEHRG